MNILSAFSRDRLRAHQDAVAPLAQPIGEARVVHEGRDLVPAGKNACDTYECQDRLWCIQRDLCKRRATADDDDIIVSLADLRACRPDMDLLRPGELEVAQMIEAVAQHGFEATTGLKWCDVKFQVRDRARAGVRAGLVAAGLVR